ncbi:MAG: hypothetical protein VYA33_03805 [Pseudomonadota bacterium]|nr:hypothetical protein [Pseudomonadota bacterium]
MSDINFDKYGNEEFFKLFLAAVKETYGDYCTFKEHEENLTEYSEPVFEKSIEEAERRLCSIVQELENSNERVKELELHANSIADALGFNAENNNRFATSVICTNIRNLHSFSDCLSRIENAFLMVESETDEFGETSEDVAFSKWGLTPHEYCIEFGKWLNKFAIEKQLETANKCAFGSTGWVLEHIKFLEERLRKEQNQ